MRNILLLVCGAAAAIAAGLYFGLAQNTPVSTAATAVTEGGPATLNCGFDTYDALDRYAELSKNEREFYALGMGYANTGTKAQHETLRNAFDALRFPADRTPIVMADLEGGKLHSFLCEEKQCSRTEIAQDAPLACMNATGAKRCLAYAVRVDNVFYCTIGPGFNDD